MRKGDNVSLNHEPQRDEFPDGPDGDEDYERVVAAFDRKVDDAIEARMERRRGAH